MKIFLANPRGFCAGVKRAINIVEKALFLYGTPIYVYHEIVHNNYVVQDLKTRGVIFINNISEVPDKSVLIFSAHGVSKKIKTEAKLRNLLLIIDAVCPLVSKVHKQVLHASKEKIETILIGHAGHPEIEGTLGQYNNKSHIYLIESIKDIKKLNIKNKNKICFVTQTTLSIYETSEKINILRKRFPKIIGPKKEDICYATINRQNAIKILAKKSDIILVIGSKNSSNSNRLFELANKYKTSFLIDSKNDIKKSWFSNINSVGITAGASAPECLVQNVVKYLLTIGGKNPIEIPGKCEKKINFNIPKKIFLKK